MSVNVISPVDSLSEKLASGVTYEPLVDAVSLWPCMHTLDEGTAVKKYGEMVDQKCSKVGIACVFCTVPVIGYKKNKLIREVATEFEDLKEVWNNEHKELITLRNSLSMIDSKAINSVNEIPGNHYDSMEISENIHQRKKMKTKLRDENLDEYHIVHKDQHFNPNALLCIANCFGWSVNVGFDQHDHI